MKDPIPSDLLDELSMQKLVIMVEVEPQTDHFHPLMLTKEQLNLVKNTLNKTFPRGNNGVAVCPTRDQFHVDLPEIQETYTAEEIEEIAGKSPTDIDPPEAELGGV